MKVKIYLGFVTIAALMACNNEVKNAGDSKDTTAVTQSAEVDTLLSFNDVKQQSIYNAYITLKNDLVNTNFDEAKQSAKLLAVALKEYKGCENTAVTAGKIENAEDIAAQRKEFTSLNTDLIALFKHADLKAGKIYVQHCPMANHGDGGDWLSSEKKVQNPYYGSEMMECGSVVEEIKSK